MKFLDYFSGSVFQTFKDKGAKSFDPNTKVWLRYNENIFKKLNESGYGIYFTPNGFKGGRKKENLTKLWAVYADLDVAKEGDGTVDTQERKDKLISHLSGGILPNFIIDTKNGIQPLWLIDEDKIDEETQLQFTNVINGIIEWSKQYGAKGDKVKDVTRVLRLPGYFHVKGEPYMCNVIKLHDNVNLLSDLAEAYPYQEEVRPVEKPVRDFKEGATYAEIDRIDFRDLMIRAFKESGRRLEFDDKGRAVIDGRLTGTFQGKHGDKAYLASTSHESFEGNRITATADILGVTTKEAFKWILQEFNIHPLEAKRKEKAKEVVKALKPVKENKRKQYYTWGTKALTESFAPIKSSTYTIIGSGYGQGKTTFCMNMALENVKLGHKVLYISLEMDTEELIDYIARKRAQTTIKEEIYDEIPEYKMDIYNRERKALESMELFTLKGIRGGTDINWDCLVELMDGEWDLIFIDNLNLIMRDEGVTQYEHEGRISSKFLGYTQERQTPIVVVHHYSKGGARENVKSGYSLSGNTKVMNDAHRIILIERKKMDDDAVDPPSDKDRATLKVTLDKGRGYDGNVVRLIYFKRGRFFDEFEEKEPLDFGKQFNY